MPQKTVTLEDQVYWELMDLDKGRQSSFVNEAVKDAQRILCHNPSAYAAYARGGLEAGRQEIRRQAERTRLMSQEDYQRALEHPDQENLTNLEWMEKQKEAEE